MSRSSICDTNVVLFSLVALHMLYMKYTRARPKGIRGELNLINRSMSACDQDKNEGGMITHDGKLQSPLFLRLLVE